MRLALRSCAAAALLGAAAGAQAEVEYRNLSAGGPLRHGVYGRIEVRAPAPPPVIYKQPVVATQPLGAVAAEPIYLYVPPGQVRKWEQHCHKWKACDLPVLFVRMDNSPSRLGQWKQRDWRRDRAALAAATMGAGPRRPLPAAPASQNSPR